VCTQEYTVCDINISLDERLTTMYHSRSARLQSSKLIAPTPYNHRRVATTTPSSLKTQRSTTKKGVCGITQRMVHQPNSTKHRFCASNAISRDRQKTSNDMQTTTSRSIFSKSHGQQVPAPNDQRIATIINIQKPTTAASSPIIEQWSKK